MDIIREDCIYARQSVDRKDSISIESQKTRTGRSLKSCWEKSARARYGE